MMQPRQIEIAGIHTYDEWQLILTDYQVGEAEPKLEHIDVPFADGEIEIAEAVTGEVKYKNRELKFEFDLLVHQELWAGILSDIRNRLHGQKVTVRTPDDHDYYYTGRATVDDIKKSGVVYRVEITVDAQPYKLKNNKTVVTVNAAAGTTTTVRLINERKTAQVKVVNSGEVKITNGNSTVTLSAGTWYPTNLIIKGGATELQVYADAATNITFEYKEGSL